jgi:hypothetical protein
MDRMAGKVGRSAAPGAAGLPGATPNSSQSQERVRFIALSMAII